MNRRILILVVALAILLVAGWWMWTSPSNVPVTHVDVVDAPSTAPAALRSSDANSKTPAAAAPQHAEPADSAAPGSQGTDFDPRMEEAVRALHCGPDAQARTRKKVAFFRNLVQHMEAGRSQAPAAIATYKGTADTLQSSLDECASLPEALRNQGPAVLEHLAEAGYPGARVAYANFALGSLGSRNGELIEDIDEAIRRRDLARRYLAIAAAQCDAGMASARFSLQQGGMLVDDDATRVAVIQAYYREAVQKGEDAESLQELRAALDAAARKLDDASRSRALQMADAEFARCAHTPP